MSSWESQIKPQRLLLPAAGRQAWQAPRAGARETRDSGLAGAGFISARGNWAGTERGLKDVGQSNRPWKSRRHHLSWAGSGCWLDDGKRGCVARSGWSMASGELPLLEVP